MKMEDNSNKSNGESPTSQATKQQMQTELQKKMDSPSSYTQSLSFLIRIYQSLFKLSNEKVDSFTINQISHFPLIICDKIVNMITNKQRKNLTQDEFTSCFNTLYFGSLVDKAKLIAMLCDFKQKEVININDVKLLLMHFHMRIMTDETVNNVLEIVDKFFEGKDTLSIDEFLRSSFEKNLDIIDIFITFFDKFRFFNNPQLKFFEEVQMKMMYKSPKVSKKKKILGANIASSNATFNTQVSTTVTSSNNGLFIPQLNNTCGGGSVSNSLNVIFNKGNSTQRIFQLVTFNYDNINTTLLVSEKAKKYENTIEMVPMNNAFDEDVDLRSAITNYDSDYQDMMLSYQKYCEFSNKKNNIVEKNSFGSEFNNTPRTCNGSDIVNDSKIIKNFFYSQFNKRLKLNFYDDAAQCNILKKTTIVEKKEIICYRLNKKMTKFKYVKIILIDNMIFYYNYNHKTKNFIFKKIIFIEQLYPKEIKVPFLPVNVPLPIKSSQNKIFQLQITSALHNNQLLYDFYTSEQQDFSYFGNFISSKQNLRSIDSIYEMGEEIGHGKFGKVMIATHKLSGEKVSIKTVSKIEKEHGEENFHCYQWEKDIFTFLSHISDKYIEKCYEYFETPTYIYYVNEYISGGDLKNLIINNPVGKAKTIGFINDLTRQLIRGIYGLHKYGIIHRDIKHTNTLVAIDEKKNVTLKLIDFGLSKVLGFDEFANEHYGSLSFKAPELINGSKYSFNVDVWALGVTVYFMLYGTYPVKAENKHLLKKKILNFNFDFSQIIQFGNLNDYMNKVMIKCFVKDPKKRPSIFLLNKIKLDYDEYDNY